MLKTLLELFRLLDQDERRTFVRLQLLVSLMSMVELIAIASIGPFMAIVAKPEIVEQNKHLSQFSALLNFDSHFDLLMLLGAGVLVLLALSSCLALATNWLILKFGARLGADLGTRLFSHYMQKDWLFHTTNHSASLIQKIATETNRTTQLVVQPSLMMLSKMVLVAFIVSGVFIFNPTVALAGLCLFATAYTLIFRTIKARLVRNGELVSQHSRQQYLTLSEGFGGIKDTLIKNKQAHFTDKFEEDCVQVTRRQSINQFLSISPRYIMEVVAFAAVILLLTYLIHTHEGDLSQILPIVSIYGLAGFKMMPALQNLFFCLAQIKANIPGFQRIRADLEAIQRSRPTPRDEPLSFDQELVLQDISFTYPGKSSPALSNISLCIKPNQHVAFVGPSGSGKSTLVDIVLGLLTPDTGTILADGQPITSRNLSTWQGGLGYVPQAIFLSDKSIRENIAFGESKDNIDPERISNAVKLAQVAAFADKLPDGLETRVGERGAQLSGGQRQRIGIARALYNNPSTLVLDEATSALDGMTEAAILDSIEQLSGDRTIIAVAHRLSTVENCEVIFFIEEGKLVDQGSYQELLARNSSFQRMASSQNESEE